MALHDDLLALARRLVPPMQLGSPPATPAIADADLRRGVSTAYYSVFHLLIHEAMARIVADPALRPLVGRSFDHGKMKQVCKEYADASTVAGVLTVNRAPIAPQLRDIGSAFVHLHQARHDADYNLAATIQHLDADLLVVTAEIAFLDWVACRAEPSTGVFLTELFLRCVAKNR